MWFSSFISFVKDDTIVLVLECGIDWDYACMRGGALDWCLRAFFFFFVEMLAWIFFFWSIFATPKDTWVSDPWRESNALPSTSWMQLFLGWCYCHLSCVSSALAWVYVCVFVIRAFCLLCFLFSWPVLIFGPIPLDGGKKLEGRKLRGKKLNEKK